MFSKEVLIDSLTVVKERALSGEIKWDTAGICMNWSEELENSDDLGYLLVETFSPSWEHFSGEKCSPVIGYYCREYLWQGEQLELRLSLIDHILKRLEEANQEWLYKLYSDYCADNNY